MGVQQSQPPIPERSCANCGTPLIGRYCHECGQTAHLHRSLLHFGEEALHGLLHFDAKALRTLPLLALRPGVLTRRYIEGQRTRYVSPMLLFLFCIILMVYVVEITAGSVPSQRVNPAQRAAALNELSREVAQDDAAVASAESALAQAQRSGTALDDARARLIAARSQQHTARVVLQAFRSALPQPSTAAGGSIQWLDALSTLDVRTGHPRLDAALGRILKNPYLFLFRLREAASRLAFLLVPISLPFLSLLFARRRDVTAYDHVVFSLYSLSFMSLLVIVVTLLGRAGFVQAATLALLAAPPLHMFTQLRGTYRLSLSAALWRTLALLAVAGTTFLLFLCIIVVVALR